MKTVFVGFEDEKDVFSRFDVDAEKQKDVEFLFAQYDDGGYDGSAFVLFARDGKLYEVNGSHCSCYGLEGMWEPEETSLEALEKRTYFYVSCTIDQVKETIERWKQREAARKRRASK